MKKNYLLGLSFVALSLMFNSCSQDEEQIIPESTKATVEPDFFGSDGSMDETEAEEEAPTDLNTKTYSYYNYTLLKPSDLPQEKIDAMCGESTTMPLLVGSRKKKVGDVEVRNDDENLYLTFSADQYKYMKKVYLYIGAKGSIPFYSNGYPNLRKFNFKAFPYYYGGMKKATYTIPLSSIDADCFEIIAYSKVYDKQSRCYYSSFAYNESSTQTYNYSYYSGCYYYNDWVRSFEYCKQHCHDDGCLETFARKYEDTNVTCLDVPINGKKLSGWSSWFPYRILFDSQERELDIYESSDDCDVSNDAYIGRVSLTKESSDTSLNVSHLIFNLEYGGDNPGSVNNYGLSEYMLYIGPEENPYNNDGSLKSTVSESNFYSQKFDATVKRTDEITVTWDGDTDPETKVYLISYIRACNVGM